MSKENIKEIEKDETPKDFKIKEKRVGTYTFGVMLIIIGISVIIMTFTSFNFVKYILMLWPLALVGLGIEILYLNSKPNIKVKIDFTSIILMCIVLFFTAIFSLGNYCVNKILYDDDVKTMIINENVNNTYSRMLNGNVTINTDNNDKVNVDFVKNPTYGNSVEVEVKFYYDISKADNIIKILNYRDKLEKQVISFKDSSVTIKELPDFVNNVKITVHAVDESHIIYSGNIA